jgi:hypothetical protein
MKTMDKFMAILKEGNPVTYADLVYRLGVPRSNVSAYMSRAKKKHEIEETMDGNMKVFTYICDSADKLNLLAQTELRNRAEYLLKAKQTICHLDLIALLNIDLSEALCLVGYLVESGKATMKPDWMITIVD